MKQIKIQKLKDTLGKDCADTIVNGMCKDCRGYLNCVIYGYGWLFYPYKVVHMEDSKDDYIAIND